MVHFNITQATYQRLHDNLKKRCGFTLQDCRDLLRAYEDSVELLDECQSIGIDHTTHQRNVEDFLYLPDGTPRVVLDGV